MRAGAAEAQMEQRARTGILLALLLACLVVCLFPSPSQHTCADELSIRVRS